MSALNLRSRPTGSFISVPETGQDSWFFGRGICPNLDLFEKSSDLVCKTIGTALPHFQVPKLLEFVSVELGVKFGASFNNFYPIVIKAP